MANISDQNATILCPHAAQAQAVPTSTRVKLSGATPLAKDDTFTISGCPFTLPPGTPSPCIQIQWLTATVRVKVEGKALLLDSSSGLCKAATGAPQGPPNIVLTQRRVRAL